MGAIKIGQRMRALMRTLGGKSRFHTFASEVANDTTICSAVKGMPEWGGRMIDERLPFTIYQSVYH